MLPELLFVMLLRLLDGQETTLTDVAIDAEGSRDFELGRELEQGLHISPISRAQTIASMKTIERGLSQNSSLILDWSWR